MKRWGTHISRIPRQINYTQWGFVYLAPKNQYSRYLAGQSGLNTWINQRATSGLNYSKGVATYGWQLFTQTLNSLNSDRVTVALAADVAAQKQTTNAQKNESETVLSDALVLRQFYI